MLKEFKEFAMRGNVLDMAIGIVIGGVRKDCQLVREGPADAADRSPARRR